MSGNISALDLLRYDQWATPQLLPVLLSLSAEQFVQELSSELSSVRQQAVHLVLVGDRYRARILGEAVPDVAPESFATPQDLLPYRAEVETRLLRWADTVSSEELSRVTRHQTRRGEYVMTVEQTILHVVNHGTYHRGQIACLLKIHGVNPVDTDMVIYWNQDVFTAS